MLSSADATRRREVTFPVHFFRLVECARHNSLGGPCGSFWCSPLAFIQQRRSAFLPVDAQHQSDRCLSCELEAVFIGARR